MSTADRRRVAVWRNALLPISETFIRNQVDALQRWEPRLIGLHSVRPSLAVDDAVVLDRDERFTRAHWVLANRGGYVRPFSRWLRHHPVDLVHGHFVTDSMLIWRSAERARVPLVVTAHGYDVTQSAALFARDHPRIWRRYVGSVSQFLPVSTYLADRLVALGVPPGKITVHYTGVPVGPPPARGNRRSRSVVFVGRLVEKKGCDDLLTAVASLDSSSGAQVDLTIIGDGPLRAGLEARAKVLGVKAHFMGAQTAASVSRRISESEVLCVPSKTASAGDAEGFGMVFLEAGVAGVPAVSYRSGGVADAVEHGRTGLLVREGDTDELARALDRVLGDEGLRHRLGRAGRQRVEEQFNIGPQSAVLESIYDHVISRSR